MPPAFNFQSFEYNLRRAGLERHHHIKLGEGNRAAGMEMRGEVRSGQSVHPGKNSLSDPGAHVGEEPAVFRPHPAAQCMPALRQGGAGCGRLDLGTGVGGFAHRDLNGE